MTNEQILRRAIEKANKNIGKELFEERDLSIFGWDAHDVEYLIFSHDFAKAFWGEEEIIRIGMNKQSYLNEFIFNNAKKKLISNKDRTLDELRQTVINDWKVFKSQGKIKPTWKYHLQQMVLEEDPIKYLEKFI